MEFITNSTLCSSPDEYGFCYWCSFSAKPFAKGKRLYTHHGILNGRGPKFGVVHVVKCFRNKRGSESLCDIELKKNQTSRELTKTFSNHFGLTKGLGFVPLLKALMDETALFSCSASHKRSLFKDEWVLIEERLGKGFKSFIDCDGKVHKRARNRVILNAFVHFSFHWSSGSLVVCGLEGCIKNGTYRLKTPTVHSVSQNFGECDNGVVGIFDVFTQHRCNTLCKDFILPSPELSARAVEDIANIPDDLVSNWSSDRASELESSSGSVSMRERMVPTSPSAEESHVVEINLLV